MTYTPNTWKNGDIITAEKLNALEQAVAESSGMQLYGPYYAYTGFDPDEYTYTDATLTSGSGHNLEFGEAWSYDDETESWTKVCAPMDTDFYVFPVSASINPHPKSDPVATVDISMDGYDARMSANQYNPSYPRIYYNNRTGENVVIDGGNITFVFYSPVELVPFSSVFE